MTRLSLVILLCAFGTSSDVLAQEPAPKPVATLDPDPTATRYVLASRLNLRDEPGGQRVGRLSINSPVDVLEERGPDVRVRTGNDKEGWVPAQFLSEEPVEILAALAAAGAAETPEERLSWAQRAAAIDFRHRQALEVLADAYRSVGKEESANAVEQRLTWPDDILLAGHVTERRTDGQIALEWGVTERFQVADNDEDGTPNVGRDDFEGDDCDDEDPHVYPGADDPRGDGVDQDCDGTDGTSDPEKPSYGLDIGIIPPPEGFILTPTAMKKRGVGLGTDVWVLPERSAAVKGTVAGMRLTPANECEDTWLWMLDVEVTLPEGERPIAYTIKSPPRTWKEPTPVRDFDAARAAVLAEVGPEFAAFHMVAQGDGVGVRAVREDRPSVPSDAQLFSIRDYEVSPDGSASLRASFVFDAWMSSYDRWWVGRDLDADGRLERIDISFCRHILYDANGTVLDQSALRCCSC